MHFSAQYSALNKRVGWLYFPSRIRSNNIPYETLPVKANHRSSVAMSTHLEVLHEAVASVKDLEKVLAGLSIGGVHHSSQWGSSH